MAPLYAIGAAASSVVSQLFGAKPDINQFASFSAVEDLFSRESAVPAANQGEAQKSRQRDVLTFQHLALHHQALMMYHRVSPWHYSCVCHVAATVWLLEILLLLCFASFKKRSLVSCTQARCLRWPATHILKYVTQEKMLVLIMEHQSDSHTKGA